MRLENLLPRPLDLSGGAECATLMGALFSAIHLDRRRARSLGWRGVRPSGALRPAWTFRVAGSGHVFGLVFVRERARGDALSGEFAAYVFPKPEDSALDAFPLEALRIACAEGYAGRIRDLSAHAEEAEPFRLGTVRMLAAAGGFSLSLVAPARNRVVAVEGVRVPGSEEWLVKPGEPETDVPAFRLLLRPFAALAATAETLLEEPADVALSVRSAPVLGFDATGLFPLPGLTGHELSLTAAFGGAAASGRPIRLPLRHTPHAEEAGNLPVLHILSGFLGSGKTTFLKRWLDFLHGRERYTGVIQNEFGEIGLDAALMRDDARVEALDEGCVCCSLADSLRPGLLRLMADMPAEQFILETTGLANPANILASLGELGDLVLPGMVVTVMDALDLRGAGRELRGVRLAQAERADVLVVNKADAVEPDALDALVARLRGLNPQALILPARYGAIAFAELDAFHSAWLDRRGRTLPSHRPVLPRLGETVTHADEGYESVTLRLDAPLSEAAIRELVREAGPGVCRAKGIVDLDGAGPVVVQYAAGRLDFWPAPEGETERYLVLIGTGLRETPEETRVAD